MTANTAVLALGVVAALTVGNPASSASGPEVRDAAAIEASPLPVAPVVTPAPVVTAAPAPKVTRAPTPTRTPTPTPTHQTRTPTTGLLRGTATTTPRDISAYRGLGTWVDAYDFAPEFGGTLSPAAVDRMAAAGIRTIYLQAAKEDRRSPGALVRPDLVRLWVARAHARGIKVQAWYLPKLVSPARDEAHLAALLAFRVNGRGFDSIGLDIEARNVPSVAVRNQRLVALCQRLRAAAPDLPLSAIVLAPVVTDVVNPAYWPAFPWAQLRASFDVWQTMGYWTDRKASSPYSNSYTSTLANVALLRQHLGDVPIHPIGGVGVKTVPELEGFIKALTDAGAMGGSLYDWVTTPYNAYGYLQRVPS